MVQSNWEKPELLCEIDWLAKHMTDDNIVIVDCDLLPAYQRLHIPGSVWNPSRYWKSKIPGEELYGINTPKEFSELMSHMGIKNESHVIAYDSSGGLYAARMWWTLRRFGHTEFQVLHGGLNKWHAEGKPVESVPLKPPRRPTPSSYEAAALKDLGSCDINAVKENIGNSDHVFWDVRSDSEWNGTNSRGTLRGGRVPGSVHLEWSHTIDEPLRTFKTPDSLRELLTEKGIIPEKVVTTYCQSGIRAALGAFLLELLGYPSAQVYDGSWGEYGNANTEYPIETENSNER